jgi:hypothetical protein
MNEKGDEDSASLTVVRWCKEREENDHEGGKNGKKLINFGI